MNGYNPNYFNRKTVDSMKNALVKVLSEQPEQPTKKRIMTTSGREGGIGSGKTLMQPDKTWDEIAREGLDKTVAFKGKDLSKVKLERKDGKVYADGIELTTASTKTSAYAADAPTRAEINAANAPKQTQTAPVATPKPSATTPAPSGGGKPLFAPPSPKPQETFPPGGAGGTPIPGSPDWKQLPNGTRITSTSGTGVNQRIAGVDITSLPQAGQDAIQAQMSTPAALRQADKRIADATKTTAQKAAEGQGEVLGLVGKAAQSAISLDPLEMAKNLAQAQLKQVQTTVGAATGYASDIATAASNLITGRPGDRGYAGNRPDVIPVRPAPVNDSEKVLPPGAFRSGTAPTGTPSSGPQIKSVVPQTAPQSAKSAFQAANETPAARRLRERLGKSTPNQGFNMPMNPVKKKQNIPNYSAGI